MWGDEFRKYFELFSISQPDDNERWRDAREYQRQLERMLERPNVTLGGKKFDPTAQTAEGVLIDLLVDRMGNLIRLKLFERRRQTWPPRLEYRSTQFGKWVYQLGHTENQFKKFIYRSLFFAFSIYARILKFKWIIAIAAGAMALLNAVKFFEFALDTISYGMLWLIGVVATVIMIGINALNR